MTEKRLISLDEALDATHNEMFWTESEAAAVRSFLVKRPRVDAVEVVHGQWIAVPSSDMMTGKAYKCSECNKCGTVRLCLTTAKTAVHRWMRKAGSG